MQVNVALVLMGANCDCGWRMKTPAPAGEEGDAIVSAAIRDCVSIHSAPLHASHAMHVPADRFSYCTGITPQGMLWPAE